MAEDKMVTARIPLKVLAKFDAEAKKRDVTRTALLVEAMEHLLNPRAAVRKPRPVSELKWEPNPRQEALNKGKK